VVHLLDALTAGRSVFAAELRPPRAELERSAGMNAWIDTYHSVVGLTRRRRFVFLTDSAVGAAEEDNLRHLVSNLGDDVPRGRIVPFLTCKHSLDYCLSYAERAHQSGFPALVVLGGDRHVGPARCVEHAYQLRQAIRAVQPDLRLGGWANPHADAVGQTDFLLDPGFCAEFFLTQVVSHHDAPVVERFVHSIDRRGVHLPAIFGVFYYRSANPRTLETLRTFLPVPVEGLTAEFTRGATPAEVCARTLRTLLDIGAKHFYISNLPLAGAGRTLATILELVGAPI